ncbi:MAG: ExbD/TolR family protein [Aureispira sp.]
MKREKVPPINAGSMADVAFLLLIFFLVTTTIQTEAGLSTTLPPWSTDYKSIHHENVLNIRLNGLGQLSIEEKKASLEELPMYIEQLLRTIPAQKAVVHLEHDKQVDYANYLAVYDVVKTDYKARWEASAMAQYGRSYENLTPDLQQGIRKTLPLVFAETQWEAPK